jgi:hypothetical protein
MASVTAQSRAAVRATHALPEDRATRIVELAPYTIVRSRLSGGFHPRSSRPPAYEIEDPRLFDRGSSSSSASELVPGSARRRRPHLLEAGAAVDRLVAAGLERHACLATAVAAGSREELTRATHATAAAVCTAAATHATGGATRRTAGRATSRLVHETARGVELLLAGRPCEFLTAVFAGQSLVREAQFEASSLCCSRRLEPRQDPGGGASLDPRGDSRRRCPFGAYQA